MNKRPITNVAVQARAIFRSPIRYVLMTLTMAGLAAGIATIAFAVPAGQTKETKTSVPALNITAANPRRDSWPANIEVSGPISPWQEAVIGSQVAGLRLLEIHAEVGDHVHKGQVVARFDTEMLRADEAQLKANLSQAEANAAQAEINSQRALLLRDSGGLSEQDILQNQTQAATTRAQVNAVKAQLEAKRLQLRYAEVVAPDDGVISARSATLGAVSSSGQELFRLFRQNRLEWRGELTATQLAQIKTGQTIQLDLPDGSHAVAKVRKIAPALNNESRLGTLFADLEPGSRARVGMYANGRILLAQMPALVVPAASVIIRDGRSYVATLKENQKLSAVSLNAVSTGRHKDQEVEILQGLSENQQVVAQGAGFLNDGDLVQVLSGIEISK